MQYWSGTKVDYQQAWVPRSFNSNFFPIVLFEKKIYFQILTDEMPLEHNS